MAGAITPETGAYGIRAIDPCTPGALVCGDPSCGRAWAEDITPAARCPWEYLHEDTHPEPAPDRGYSGNALDVWLRIPPCEHELTPAPCDCDDEAEAEANTYLTDDNRFRVDWSLTAVGLIKSREFDTYREASQWLTGEGFADYTS